MFSAAAWCLSGAHAGDQSPIQSSAAATMSVARSARMVVQWMGSRAESSYNSQSLKAPMTFASKRWSFRGREVMLAGHGRGFRDRRHTFGVPVAVVRVLDAEGFQLELDETRFVCWRAARWGLVQDREAEMVVEDRRAVLLR